MGERHPSCPSVHPSINCILQPYVGRKGEYLRLFLDEAGYKKAREEEAARHIEIIRYMVLENGEKVVLFKPLEPYETPDAINMICENYQAALDKEVVDELILIPCFILDFLCVHPFNDGNGRMSRLLTLLLLYRRDYLVGKYISIEKAIADTKEAYYDALQKADQGWHEEKNDPKPFIKYMLGVILSCYREFENRVNVVNDSGTKSTSYDVVKAYVEERIGKFSKQEVLIGCPSLGSSSVESALKKLVEDGTLIRIGAGRKTLYARADSIEE